VASEVVERWPAYGGQEERRLAEVQGGDGFTQVALARGRHAQDVWPELYAIEIGDEDLLLAQRALDAKSQGDLAELAEQRARPVEASARQLLRDGAGSRDDVAPQKELPGGACHGDWVDAGMGPEARILGREQDRDGVPTQVPGQERTAPDVAFAASTRQEQTLAVVDAQARRLMGPQGLGQRQGVRIGEQGRRPAQQDGESSGQNPQASQGHGAFHRTSTVRAPVRPKTSSWYISIARDGGVTKLPMVVARAR
jgi:hypothetical protein